MVLKWICVRVQACVPVNVNGCPVINILRKIVSVTFFELDDALNPFSEKNFCGKS